MRDYEMRVRLRGTVQASHPDGTAVTLALKTKEEQFNLTKLMGLVAAARTSGC